MTPSYSTKGGVRYRYHVSRAFTEGRKKTAGSIVRVSAPEIETFVSNALRSLEHVISADQPIDGPSLIKQIVDQVIIAKGDVTIRLTDEAAEAAGQQAIILPWSRKPTRVKREIIAPDIVEAAVAGTLPRGIGVTRLTDLPSSWVMQREKLGLLARA
jgi:hypothetical protein